MNIDDPQNHDPAPTVIEDPFDRLYLRWAETTFSRGPDTPSRERWDEIVLRLISSQDPERVRLYRRIEAAGEDSLGADAYALWHKLPDYTPDRSAPAKTRPELTAYAGEHIGSMRRLMEARGLGDKYEAIIAGQPPPRAASREATAPGKPVDSTQARGAQTRIMLIGCVGIMIIVFMMLTVLLIIVLKTLG